MNTEQNATRDRAETIESLRAKADPNKNIDSATIRAYGRAKPSAIRDGTVPAALRGHRASRAEIAMVLGYKTFELRPWMARRNWNR